MDHAWSVLLDIVLLLAGATILGLLCERLGQNVIIGYILAGMVLGPDVLNQVTNQAAIDGLAELGVALLLFTIGLEFSWREVSGLGRIRLMAGGLQVAVTMLLAAIVGAALGLPMRSALAVGAIVALSSTACVLSVLEARAEVDSFHARHAIVILLLQDLALIPMVVLVRALGGGASAWGVVKALGISLVASVALVVVFRVLANRVLALLFRATAAASSRELAILLTLSTCLGASWAAHSLGLSPALGAFVAGMLLAETPFATRVRADIASLKTIFVALFFGSIGLLARPAWAGDHLGSLALLVVAIVVGKALVVALIGIVQKEPAWPAIASGLCIAQVGEFSFVLIGLATSGGLLAPDAQRLLTAGAVVTMLVTPYLVASAPVVASRVVRLLRLAGALRAAPADSAGSPAEGHVIVVGLGPAGLDIVHALVEAGISVVVVELNVRAVRQAEREGIRAVVGDAADEGVLRHLGIDRARAIVVTVPDLRSSATIIAHARALAPHVPVVARARYHIHAIHFLAAGAHVVVDEEREVGKRIGAEVRAILAGGERAPEA